MKYLSIISDAWGSRGGIAQLTCDFLEALTSIEGVEGVSIVSQRKLTFPNGHSPPDKLHLVASGLSKISLIFAITKELFKNKWDYVICHHIKYLPLLFVMKKLFKFRLTCVVYGIDVFEKELGFIRKRAYRIALKECERIIAPGTFTKSQLIKWNPHLQSRISILFPCVDFNRYFPKPQSVSVSQDVLKLLSVGRLVYADREKGVFRMMVILKELKGKIPFKYRIVGDGPAALELKNYVQKMGLKDYVEFLGDLSDEKKIDQYHESDLFVMPSKKEGFGIVIIEAAACGLYVCASGEDGTFDALHNESLGKAIPADDISGWCQYLETYYRTPKNLRPRPNKASIEYFSKENFQKQVSKIFTPSYGGG